MEVKVTNDKLSKKINSYIAKFPWYYKYTLQQPHWINQPTYNGYEYYIKIADDKFIIFIFKINLNCGCTKSYYKYVTAIRENIIWNQPVNKSYFRAIDYYIHKYPWAQLNSNDNIYIKKHGKTYKIQYNGKLKQETKMKYMFWNPIKNEY